MSQVIDLDAGRLAAKGGRWRDAYVAYSSADLGELSGEDLEAFAESAWWSCNVEQAVDLRERAYTAYDKSGDLRGAARVALALSSDYNSRGAYSIARGWFAKAERLVARIPESPEYALFLLEKAMEVVFAGGDLATAITDLDRAYELAERVGDRSLQALALTGKGKALVDAGEVDKGLALLDEATAAAVSGELKAFATGIVYCATISSCHEVGDYRRAAEWTEAANRWCDRLDVSGFPGACRIHRAELLRLRGDWPAAEEQAVAACEEIKDFNQSIAAGGYYEIGEIRRRRGDFAAAAEAYRKTDELGRDPQPGMALLRLAEGKVDAAVHAMRRTLDGVSAPLMRLNRLPAQVQIALAAGDLATARQAFAELERLVDAYKIDKETPPAFVATVHLASGQIKLAEGDWDGAARCLRRTREEWQKVGAPYETAQCRMLLGIAYRRQGDEDGATAEFDAALRTFERLGAKLDEERAKELLGRLETRRTFLFTDIVSSTKLLETLGNEKWKKLLARHDEVLRECIVDAGGDVIKQTGDGFFASFDQPKAAIEAAVAIQRALDAEIFAPDVRIGVHTGGAFVNEGDFTDYGGEGVHTAARVGAAAGPKEILVSSDTLEDFEHVFSLSPPRVAELKGFEDPVAVVSVDWR